MDHDLELIIPTLEILEIEVSTILYNPGNIGNLSFSNFSHPGNIGNLLSNFSYGGNAGGGRAAPGVRLRRLGFFGDPVP